MHALFFLDFLFQTQIFMFQTPLGNIKKSRKNPRPTDPTPNEGDLREWVLVFVLINFVLVCSWFAVFFFNFVFVVQGLSFDLFNFVIVFAGFAV